MPGSLPRFGMTSTYSDYFLDGGVADSTHVRVDGYTHEGFTAALLGNHRGAVHFGTRLLLSYLDRSVVVIVDDNGSGKEGEDRVLDLSRVATACLVGRRPDQVTDTSAGLLNVTIEVVNSVTPVGPWEPSGETAPVAPCCPSVQFPRSPPTRQTRISVDLDRLYWRRWQREHGGCKSPRPEEAIMTCCGRRGTMRQRAGESSAWSCSGRRRQGVASVVNAA